MQNDRHVCCLSTERWTKTDCSESLVGSVAHCIRVLPYYDRLSNRNIEKEYLLVAPFSYTCDQHSFSLFFFFFFFVVEWIYICQHYKHRKLLYIQINTDNSEYLLHALILKMVC